MFGNWFSGLLFNLRGLFKNPMMIFIYGILSKWYITVMVAAIVVTFWVFKGLSEAGIIDEAEKTVTTALDETKSVAKHCVPKILNFAEFWRCLDNPPKYVPSKEEKQLKETLEKILPDLSNSEDPYAPEDNNGSLNSTPHHNGSSR